MRVGTLVEWRGGDGEIEEGYCYGRYTNKA